MILLIQLKFRPRCSAFVPLSTSSSVLTAYDDLLSEKTPSTAPRKTPLVPFVGSRPRDAASGASGFSQPALRNSRLSCFLFLSHFVQHRQLIAGNALHRGRIENEEKKGGVVRGEEKLRQSHCRGEIRVGTNGSSVIHCTRIPAVISGRRRRVIIDSPSFLFSTRHVPYPSSFPNYDFLNKFSPSSESALVLHLSQIPVTKHETCSFIHQHRSPSKYYPICSLYRGRVYRLIREIDGSIDRWSFIQGELACSSWISDRIRNARPAARDTRCALRASLYLSSAMRQRH